VRACEKKTKRAFSSWISFSLYRPRAAEALLSWALLTSPHALPAAANRFALSVFVRTGCYYYLCRVITIIMSGLGLGRRDGSNACGWVRILHAWYENEMEVHNLPGQAGIESFMLFGWFQRKTEGEKFVLSDYVYQRMSFCFVRLPQKHRPPWVVLLWKKNLPIFITKWSSLVTVSDFFFVTSCAWKITTSDETEPYH
jgi:hypothetical protein